MGLRENFCRDDEIEEPNWGPSHPQPRSFIVLREGVLNFSYREARSVLVDILALARMYSEYLLSTVTVFDTFNFGNVASTPSPIPRILYFRVACFLLRG